MENIMNKFLALSVSFLALVSAHAAYMSRPADRVSSLDDTLHTSPAPQQIIELAPVFIEADVPLPAKPVAKKRSCISYPMYAGGTQTVRICS